MTLFLAILGICKVNAQNKYTVTVNVQVTYVYYTDQYYTDEAFETDMAGQQQTFTVCADTPNEAEDDPNEVLFVIDQWEENLVLKF